MLIGFTGVKGSGKDTAAQFLIEQGYLKMAFADQLKRAVAALWDIPLEEVDKCKEYSYFVQLEGLAKMSFREFLQRFGTEMGRYVFGTDFWVDQWNSQYDALFVLEPDQARKVVVPDVRFRNEAVRLQFMGGQIIRIERPGYEPDGHESEAGIPDDLIDATITNDAGIETLGRRVRTTVVGLQMGVTGG